MLAKEPNWRLAVASRLSVTPSGDDSDGMEWNHSGWKKPPLGVRVEFISFATSPYGLPYIARHVIGCLVTKKTRAQQSSNDE